MDNELEVGAMGKLKDKAEILYILCETAKMATDKQIIIIIKVSECS